MQSSSMDDILDQTVSRIVDVAHPRRIILFGSAARGDLNPDSDIDLLVVVAPGTHRRKTAQKIYRHLIGVGSAVDIVVVTEDDIAQYKNHQGMIIQPVLQEGREIYVV